MSTRIALFALAWLLVLASCTSFPPPNAPSRSLRTGDEFVWVARAYSGGRQCEPTIPYTPPDIESVLGEAGIEVFETRVEHLAVCAACECAAYAAMHYARIRKADLVKAQALGFEEKTPPEWWRQR